MSGRGIVQLEKGINAIERRVGESERSKPRPSKL